MADFTLHVLEMNVVIEAEQFKPAYEAIAKFEDARTFFDKGASKQAFEKAYPNLQSAIDSEFECILEEDHIELLELQGDNPTEDFESFLGFFNIISQYVQKGSEIFVEREYDEVEDCWRPGDEPELWEFNGWNMKDEDGLSVSGY